MGEFVISMYRSDDMTELNQLVANHDPNMPFLNEAGKQIGTVVRVWRDGMLLMGLVKEN